MKSNRDTWTIILLSFGLMVNSIGDIIHSFTKH